MRRISLTFVPLLILLLAGFTYAVDLKPSPIQSRFDADLGPSGQDLLAFAEDDSWLSDDEDSTLAGSDRAPGVRRKSVVKAAALSALLPGLGQYYNERRTKARYFFAAEIVTWVAFGSFRMYGDWKRDDFIQYGNTHANAQLDGKSDEFHDWVGFYEDIDQYNAEGRVADQDRPYLFDTPENHWHWQTADDQRIYRDLKNSSREAYRRADFMIGLAVANRLISIVDAVIDARRSTRTEGEVFMGARGLKLDINPMSRDRQVTLTVWPGF